MPKRKPRLRRSISGKIKTPLDIRSNNDLQHLIKTLNNKPLAIILVYATWCPHCHTIMPTFNSAANNPKNTISAISIESKMVDKANECINRMNPSAKPINVSGYPSAFLVTKNGTIIKEVEPLNGKSIKSIMQNAGPLAEQVNLNSNVSKYIGTPESAIRLNDASMTNSYPTTPYPTSLKESIVNLQAPTSPLSQNTIETVIPPLPQTIMEHRLQGSKPTGGSLMSAMARASYSLAPTAALITIADIIKHGKTRKSSTCFVRSKRSTRSKRSKRSKR